MAATCFMLDPSAQTKRKADVSLNKLKEPLQKRTSGSVRLTKHFHPQSLKCVPHWSPSLHHLPMCFFPTSFWKFILRFKSLAQIHHLALVRKRFCFWFLCLLFFLSLNGIIYNNKNQSDWFLADLRNKPSIKVNLIYI